MQVWPCGTTCIVGDDVNATIRTISINPEGVSYELMWWQGRDRKTAWFYDSEFEVNNGTRKATLGFNSF